MSATLDGLLQLRTASQISDIRGESVTGPAFTHEQAQETIKVEASSE